MNPILFSTFRESIGQLYDAAASLCHYADTKTEKKRLFGMARRLFEMREAIGKMETKACKRWGMPLPTETQRMPGKAKAAKRGRKKG